MARHSLPTTWVHMCSVLYVSCHASSAREGHTSSRVKEPAISAHSRERPWHHSYCESRHTWQLFLQSARLHPTRTAKSTKAKTATTGRATLKRPASALA